MNAFSLFAVASLAVVSAECPNACSGYGECGEFDSCTCFSGYQGGDCSERVCLYDFSWIATPNGDLNFDGDVRDGTVYSPTIPIADNAAEAILLTQAAPGGTWESWPYQHVAQEGHFYMECSNRGLCDRATGECECFDGYSGAACKRHVCPDDCSGKGQCVTVADASSGVYDFWDADKARFCQCDAGYTGPTCSEMLCPLGDDPLTKEGQRYETQFVDIYTTCYTNADGTASTGCATQTSGSFVNLGGYAKLEFTDSYGKNWKTEPFLVQVMDGSSDADQVALDAEQALIDLPNNVTNENIQITAQFCEAWKGSPVTMVDTGIGVHTGSYRISGSNVVITDDASAAIAVVSSTASAEGGAVSGLGTASSDISVLAYPNCIRLMVDFVDMPGNIVNLGVDVSEVTYAGETNAMNPNAGVTFATTTNLVIGNSGTGATVSFTKDVSATDTGSTVASNNVITFTAGATPIAQTAANTFFVGAAIQVSCAGRSLGEYTIASIDSASDPQTITVAETIIQSTCDSVAGTMVVTQTSLVINTGDFDATVLSDYTGLEINPGTSDLGLTIGSLYDGYIIAAENLNSDVFNHDAGSGSVYVGPSDVAAATVVLKLDTVGTRENVLCSDRGICNYEEGVCNCFAGYTGDSCHVQRAIAA